MNTRWHQGTDAYEFGTDRIFGTLSPFGYYHGLTGLQHHTSQVNLVRPGKSFLNAEYYIRPGSGRKQLPRAISGERRTSHELVDDGIALHFPPEDEYRLSLDLRYAIHDDIITMEMTITQEIDVPGFEIFFASYVCEAFKETWVPLTGHDGSRDWTKLDNRNTINDIFGVMRDTDDLDHIPSGYPDSHVNVEAQPFHEPMLVARDPGSGLALIFLCDPHMTKYLAGQYHGWDTAHDWAFGADLTAGTPISARAQLVCRHFPDTEQMLQEVVRLWDAFV